MKHPRPMEPAPHDAPVRDSETIEAQRWLAGMMADLADSVNGITLRGARAVPIGQASQGTLRPMGSSSQGRLVGWSMRESTGTGSVLVRIYDGADANGTLLATIPLAAAAEAVNGATTSTQSLPGGGVSITNGLVVVLSDPVNTANPPTGSVEGSIWLGAVE